MGGLLAIADGVLWVLALRNHDRDKPARATWVRPMRDRLVLGRTF